MWGVPHGAPQSLECGEMKGDQRFGDVGRDAEALASRLAPSVVEIRAGSGIGAGTIWRPDGLIVTNDHVVPFGRAEIGLSDRRNVIGQVVARDPGNDLAVIAVDLGGLPAVDLRRDPVRPGELLMAIGHPFGVRHAVALGIVSTALSPVEGFERPLIRADVPIGPGSSGGPLVDALGRVVGINAMVGGGLALAVPGLLAEGLVRAVVARAAA
jgi:serine protease Do